MRYLVCFVFVLALVASPLRVSAQAGEDDPLSGQPAPASEPVAEEPALKLELDDAGVEVAPSHRGAFVGYTIEELELRKRRAAFGLIAPAALIVAAVPLLVLGVRGDCAGEPWSATYPQRCDGIRASGIALTVTGGVGMIVESIIVGARTHELKLAIHDYTLEELNVRVRRGTIGLGVSGGVFIVGVAMGGAALGNAFALLGQPVPGWVGAVGAIGATLMTGGLFGMIISGSLLRVRKRRLRQPQEVHYGTPRKVQWDVTRSALVF